VYHKWLIILSATILFSCTEQQSLIPEIKQLEFGRTHDPELFAPFANSPQVHSRLEAAISMGRIQDSVFLPTLMTLVDDQEAPVARAAIFAIGQIGGDQSRNFLAQIFQDDTYQNFRMDVVKALGRIKGTDTVNLLLSLLPQLSDSLCAAAIHGLTFQTDKSMEKKVGKIIAEYIEHEDDLIQNAAYYYFSRHRYSRAAKLLIENPAEQNTLAEKYRLKGLDKSITKYLISVWDTLMVDSLHEDLKWQLNDRKTSWQLKYYQMSILTHFSDSLSVRLTGKFLGNPNPHLRTQAISLLGKQKGPETKNILLNYYANATWTEKGEIIIILAQLDRHLAFRLIQQNLDQGTLYFKQQLLKALAKIGDRASIRQLRQFLIVPNPRLNLTAFIELDKRKRMSYKYVKPFFESDDDLMITIAAGWVSENPKQGKIADLIKAYNRLSAPRQLDAMQAIIDAVGLLDVPERREFLLQVYNTSNSAVLVHQTSQLLQKMGENLQPRPEITQELFVPDTLVDINTSPQVVIETDRGNITIELLSSLAPATVSNYLYLVKKQFYDNTAFHRVVSDFVVQGGDPTGTGWGGPGYSIPCEYSAEPFKRGTVGMATAGKDTGGSQFFICHSEQPHLDGRYTVFGRVISGMDVVDQIQIDDTINKISILN
jgi:cyclophilin family peptidyl-prolyl cis-trans isomerase/HEAT repeat protein